MSREPVLLPGTRSARALVCVASLASLLFFDACHRPLKTARAPAPSGPMVIGEVSVVNRERHFVLVDIGSGMYLPNENAELKTMRDGVETGRLKISAERKRPFVTADIVSGDPATGDQVSGHDQ